MIIAFMGVDGSGKTTTSMLLYKKLKSLNLPVEYWRGFDHFILNFLLRFMDKFLRRTNVENMREFFLTRSLEKPFYFRLWPLLVWFDYLIGWLHLSFFKRSSIIIFDRYALDSLVSWKYFGYNNAVVNILYLHFPGPELPFILDVPPEISFRRSKYNHKFPFYFYAIQRERYLNLAAMLSIKVLDAQRSPFDVVSEIVDYLRKRYPISLVKV